MAVEFDSADFERDLQNYIDNLLPQGLEKGLTKACVAVEAEAKRRSPVDDGILRASITHQVENLVGYVGSGVEYAPYVHQGTGIYAVNGDGRKEPWIYKDAEGKVHKTVGQQPQPFLQDAVDSLEGKLADIIEGGLRNA